MKTGNLLFSAVQFVFAALVVLLGGLFIGLEYAPHLRYYIADFFQLTPHFSLIGYLVLGCGILLMIGFFGMHRGEYYQVKMGTEVDPAVIQAYVQDYWARQFPEQDLSVQVGLSRHQKIEMLVELPSMPLENHTAILERTEQDLGQILKKRLGYQKEFAVSVLIK